ncbi:MAG: hypothetical protein DYH16_06675, partial [Nitrosomonas sp. PRO5]|nr:hypothetical protein [Nitrosomonas sp. PRO5]
MPSDSSRNLMEPVTSQANDEIDLGELLDVLADNKKLILVITFITCLIGAAISFLSRP